MANLKCITCEHTFISKRDLTKHLNKKYPCAEQKFICDDCGARYTNKPSLHEHKKVCKGPIVTVEDSLRNEIEDLKQQIEDLVETDKKLTIKPIGYGQTIEILRPQIYFGIPGSLLKLENVPDFSHVTIKFGYTDEPKKRFPTHDRDFGGFHVLDSIVTENPRIIEKEFKDWLKLKNKAVKGKTDKKNSVDTELFMVKSQDEYREIVELAKSIADGIVERKDATKKQAAELEAEKKRHQIESLQLQLKIVQLQASLRDANASAIS